MAIMLKEEKDFKKRIFKKLISTFNGVDCIKDLKESVFENKKDFNLKINNVVGFAGNILLSNLLEREKSSLVVVPTDLEMQKTFSFLKQISELGLIPKVCMFPDTGAAPYERIPRPPELSAEQLNVLYNVLFEDCVIIATPQAICNPVISPRNLEEFSFSISVNEEQSIETLIQKLVCMGYRNCNVVDRVGEFRRKGGILDVFSAAHPYPVRIELFDTEVESIRFFSPVSQLSIEKTDLAMMIPVHHFTCSIDEKEKVEKFIESKIENDPKISSDAVEQDLEIIKQKNSILNHLYYLPIARDEEYSIVDYLSDYSTVIIEDSNRVFDSINATFKEAEEVHGLELEKKEVVSIDLFSSYSKLKKKITEYPRIIEINQNPSNYPSEDQYAIHMEEVYSPIAGDFKATIKQYLKNDGFLFIATKQPKRVIEILDSFGFNSLNSNIEIEDLYMDKGFYLPDRKFALMTDREIFGWKRPHTHFKKFREGTPIKSVDDLAMGDVLVHYSYGIGVYRGLKLLDGPEKKPKEFLLMEYNGGDQLFVPPERLHMVNKYIGDSQNMKLSSLGTTEWERTKKKAKKGIEAIAEELVALYAKKEATRGYEFGKDTPWQKEMETIFPYDETPDQVTSINDVKQDMESDKVMDRIVTGDVGYGKTEVAIRAAFKALMEGFQVALLVPTTILANQHYETFKDRYAPFPIEIVQMSRLVHAKKIKDNIKDISEGKADLVIGTHRLLSKDMNFKKLGLLIIDEEHKFGVKHKEKIRMLKENVDVLTLTATPIPRTLSMAMSGVRSISRIDTSPEGRKPVKTYVLQDNEEVIKNAIKFELSRGGQVYFVHNRISDIMEVKERLKNLFPNVKIGVGHGRMSGDSIDRVITQFLQGELNLLLCTTIIESGIDIPTVNTLIVDNSDRLGLAQMYQLRGRVGRSNRRAYAYFFYPSNKALSQKSSSRLKAMQNFVELGSGLKIAMRDLEIRGAGNFLGTSQSGHLQSVGYHMYVKLLKDAVEKSNNPTKEYISDDLPDFPITGFIPEEFIRDEAERLSIYQELTRTKKEKELKKLVKEYADRFGKAPKQMEEFYKNLHLRILCYGKGMKEVKLDRNLIFFYFLEKSERFKITTTCLSSLCQKFGNNVHFYGGYLTVRKEDMEFNTVIREVMKCF
ncbi:MAG: transcription-repair coupling factor [Caldisericia bacterium]|nr:transcription-repair coupling factor [Caldisericia bacterium]